MIWRLCGVAFYLTDSYSAEMLTFPLKTNIEPVFEKSRIFLFGKKLRPEWMDNSEFYALTKDTCALPDLRHSALKLRTLLLWAVYDDILAVCLCYPILHVCSNSRPRVTLGEVVVGSYLSYTLFYMQLVWASILPPPPFFYFYCA
jgi:hypothetical protein